MVETLYELYVGPSPDGSAVHPYFEEGKHSTLHEAQVHAEMVAGRRLSWQWMEERKRWRAELGGGKAAEIEEMSNGPVRIMLDVSQI